VGRTARCLPLSSPRQHLSRGGDAKPMRRRHRRCTRHITLARYSSIQCDHYEVEAMANTTEVVILVNVEARDSSTVVADLRRWGYSSERFRSHEQPNPPEGATETFPAPWQSSPTKLGGPHGDRTSISHGGQPSLPLRHFFCSQLTARRGGSRLPIYASKGESPSREGWLRHARRPSGDPVKTTRKSATETRSVGEDDS
jgi:hypothetical protein